MKYINKVLKKTWNNVLFFKASIQNHLKWSPLGRWNHNNTKQPGKPVSLTASVIQPAQIIIKTAFSAVWCKVPSYLRQILVKVITPLFVVLLLYCKPFYSVVFLLLFSLEYIWLFSFLLSVYSNFEDYYMLKPLGVDLCSLNVFELWNEYCKVNAFRRLYMILLRQKGGTKQVIITLIIVLLGIPLKFLKLVYFLLRRSNLGFRKGMEILYTHAFYSVKDCKIEVFKGKIYLNPRNFKSLLRIVDKRGDTSEQTLFNLSYDLKMLVKSFEKIESKDPEYGELVLAQIETKEGVIIRGYHYAEQVERNTLHATSNTKTRLQSSQHIEAPMPSLILPNASSPGTIISREVRKIEWGVKNKMIPMHEIYGVTMFYPDLFLMDSAAYNYTLSKYNAFAAVFKAHLPKDVAIEEQVLKEFVTRCYDNDFLHISNKEMVDGILSHKQSTDV